MKTEIDGSGGVAPDGSLRVVDTGLVRLSLVGIFLLAVVYALYFARDFFMPVVLAFLLALMLTPVVRLLRKRGAAGLFLGDLAGRALRSAASRQPATCSAGRSSSLSPMRRRSVAR